MNRLCEVLKTDFALVADIANAANATGRFVRIKDFKRALFAVGIKCDDGIVSGEEITITLMEAKDGTGTDDQALIEDVVVTGLVNSAVVQSDLTTGTGVEVGDAITVNGVTFECAAATDVGELEFQDGDGLVSCVAAHCPGLVAENDAGVVTISTAEVGGATVTMEEVKGGASGWIPGGITTHALAIVEVYGPQLSAGYSHIAINVANGAANDIITAAFVARGNPTHSPIYNAVAASGFVE